MNTELQDKAWSVLPKEFKEEVKKLYREFAFTREGYYVELFGLHNLTSDAEGEEMLTVSSNSVRVYKENIDRYRPKAVSAYDKGFWIGQDAALQDLFGSKCLPDNVDSLKPKPANPKFAKGDMIHSKFFGYEGDYRVVGYTDGSPKHYDCIDKNGLNYRFPESDLEPYAEPEEKSRNLS